MPVWLANLLGGGLIDKVLSFIPNPAEKEKAKLEMQAAFMQAAIKGEADQRDINKVEAGSASMFVAGWRPAVGWLCVTVLAATWLLYPLVSWTVAICGGKLPIAPELGNADTQSLLYALLGIGTLRTVEKVTGAPMTQSILAKVRAAVP